MLGCASGGLGVCWWIDFEHSRISLFERGDGDEGFANFVGGGVGGWGVGGMREEGGGAGETGDAGESVGDAGSAFGVGGGDTGGTGGGTGSCARAGSCSSGTGSSRVAFDRR